MANDLDPTSAATLEAGSDDDSFDEVLKKIVRGPGSIAELAPGTLIAGRFAIDRVLGTGGMGTVYLAKDQTLGRDVAIKVHHAAGGATRLRREAVAMAKLAHPNVVTVFEVGELERHPFVVMEYITGSTLRAWLQTPHSVREILDVMVAAGEGLAAAHDAGLVHRDIKPENVFVGADGRVRVGDFGLAREQTSVDEPPPAGSADPALAPMTQTGAVLGTPAYMAPEQLAGDAVDARADQFAFCIMAWEALWGQRPFAGATFGELAKAVASGARRPPPPTPKVPARVRAALDRGLAREAARRFPTLHPLLAELRPPTRGRRLAIALVAGGVAIGGGLFAVIAGARHASPVSCEHAGDALTAQLPHDLPAKLRTAGVTAAATRVEAALAEYTGHLDTAARQACEAGRVRHDWSPQILAKSESCLQIAAHTAHALLEFSTIDASTVSDLVRRVKTNLPALDSCSDPTFLTAMPDVPADPAAFAAYIGARADLASALVELELGSPERARPTLDRLALMQAQAPEIAAGLSLARGLLASERNETIVAEKLLGDAYYAARTTGDDVVTAQVLGALLNAATEHPEDPQSISWARMALADAERLKSRSPWIAGRLYLGAARLADSQGDAAAALDHLAKARQVLPPGDSNIAQAWVVEAAVKLWSGHIEEGVTLYDKAIAYETERLGPDHPLIGSMLADYASLLLGAGRSGDATVVANRAMQIIARGGDATDRMLDGARVNLAAVLTEANRDDEALPLLETVRAHYLAGHGVRSTLVANVDMNLAVIYMNRPAELPKAIEMLEEALATDEQLLGRDHLEVADVLFNLAVARSKQHDLDGAVAAMQRGVAIYAAKAGGGDRHRTALGMVALFDNQKGDPAGALAATEIALGFPTPPEGKQAIALPQLERAKALITLHRAAEARPLLIAARASYAELEMTERVAEIDKLAATAHIALR